MDHREMLMPSGVSATATIAGCTGDGQSPTETETEVTAIEAATMDAPTETPNDEPSADELSVDDE